LPLKVAWGSRSGGVGAEVRLTPTPGIESLTDGCPIQLLGRLLPELLTRASADRGNKAVLAGIVRRRKLLLRFTTTELRLRDAKALERLRAWRNLIHLHRTAQLLTWGGNPSGNPGVLTRPAAMVRSDDEVNVTSGDAPRRH
jgi:hypothetical protein